MYSNVPTYLNIDEHLLNSEIIVILITVTSSVASAYTIPALSSMVPCTSFGSRYDCNVCFIGLRLAMMLDFLKYWA